MKTKNMTIREFFKTIEREYIELYDKWGMHERGLERQSDYHITLFNCSTNETLKNIYDAINPVLFRILVVDVRLMSLVFINDTYLYLKNKEQYGTISNDEMLILQKIRSDAESNEFKDMFADSKILEFMISMTKSFMEESALRKVELMKTLNPEDISLLSTVNPFFQEEYEHYNIEITDKFLMKHLNIWINKMGYEAGIAKIVGFLVNLYTVDMETCKKAIHVICNDELKEIEFMKYLKDKDFSSSFPFINDFYDSHRESLDKKI